MKLRSPHYDEGTTTYSFICKIIFFEILLSCKSLDADDAEISMIQKPQNSWHGCALAFEVVNPLI